MNIKENIMEMNRAYASQMDVEPAESIDDILLTFLVNLQVFDSCRYISEDDERLQGRTHYRGADNRVLCKALYHKVPSGNV